MKTRTFAIILLTGAGLLSGSAFAQGGIKSRNADDAYNDMVRNYGAAPSGVADKDVMTRSQEMAHADLMRNWTAQPTGQPQRAALVQSEQDRYRELVRGSFPLSQFTE